MRLVDFLKCFKNFDIVIVDSLDRDNEYFRGSYSKFKKTIYADFDVVKNHFEFEKYGGIMNVVYIII